MNHYHRLATPFGRAFDLHAALRAVPLIASNGYSRARSILHEPDVTTLPTDDETDFAVWNV